MQSRRISPTSQLVVGFLALLTAGCSHDEITFVGDKDLALAVVVGDHPEAAAEELGKGSVTVPVEKVAGKIVRASAAGKVPQYYVIGPGADLGQTKITVRLQDLAPACLATESSSMRAHSNLTHRMLMEAYKALAKSDWPLAISLSQDLAHLSPELAAPLIIQGLALLQQGKKSEAKASLVAAKTLDPDDKNIDELLQAVL